MSSSDDDLIKLYLDLRNHWFHKGESIWAKPFGSDRYEVRNVPFCAYGLNFGDVVFATPDRPNSKPSIRCVVEPGGHRTLRVFFAEGVEHARTLDQLMATGVEVERADARFVCLDLPPDVDHQTVRAALGDLESEGLLAYETCEARAEGSFDDRPSDD